MYFQSSSTFYYPEVMLLWRLQTLLSFSRGNVSNRFTTQFVAYTMDLYKYNQGTIEKIKTRLKAISHEKGQGLTDEEVIKILSQKKESEIIGYEEAIEVQELVDTEEEREKLQRIADKYLLLGEEERCRYERDSGRKDYEFKKYQNIVKRIEILEGEQPNCENISKEIDYLEKHKKNYNYLFRVFSILTVLSGIIFISSFISCLFWSSPEGLFKKLSEWYIVIGFAASTTFFFGWSWSFHLKIREESGKIIEKNNTLKVCEESIKKHKRDIADLKKQKEQYES